MLRYAALALPLALAACGPSGNSTISIKAADGDNAEGQATISLPGINASIDIPKMDVSAENFEVNGVKLYPGSKLRDVDVSATSEENDKNDHVAIRFESPASLDKVQGWFRDAMAKHHFKVSPQGTGFAGTTDDGKPVTVELEADGPDKVKGALTVGA